MKTSKRLKVTTLILVIILITILSFLGVYNVASFKKDNLVKSYQVGMELKGRKVIRLKVDDTVNEVIYDSEGNKVDQKEEGKEYTTAQEPVNSPESLNKENYKKAKDIIEERLNFLEVQEYRLRFNEENGIIEIEMNNDELTNYVISAILQKGDFKMIDDETKETLMDSSFVKNARVVYNTTESGTTVAYVDIEFNKEGTKKLEEISNVYVKTTEQVTKEDGTTEDKTVEKKVTVQIDENSITSQSFGEPLKNGHLYIPVGQQTTNNEELQRYALQASIYASIIQTGTVPFEYTIEQNDYILTDINENIIPIVAIIILAVEAIVFIVIFKLKGIMASVLQIGFMALLLLVLKYTNVCITMEGLFAIVLASIINTMFIYKVFKNNDSQKAINESLIDFINKSIPILIVAIICCFVKATAISSFGMIMFWGYVVSLLYNIVFTKGMLKNI